jgi:hypothetical protein
MKTLKFILPFIVLFSIFGCEKKVAKLPVEENVLNSVFLEIVDSIYMDRRIITPPPFPKIDFKTNKEDTLGYHAALKKFYHRQDSIKNDKKRVLIAVHDFVKSNDVDMSKFDLTPFKNNKKFDFQYASKFPEERFWNINDKNSDLPVGTIEVSNIQFNKTKTLGTLSASASCGGGKCGRGFTITIEKKSGKWKIKKIVQTWVS